jgi:hypothetical protein
MGYDGTLAVEFTLQVGDIEAVASVLLLEVMPVVGLGVE